MIGTTREKNISLDGWSRRGLTIVLDVTRTVLGAVAGIGTWRLVGPAFRREHRAVKAGLKAFRRGSSGRDSSWLRRNVHRIEKGLIMRPRRSRFAEDYILETVDCFARCVADCDADPAELRWAEDVLQSYFASTARSVVIDRARLAFSLAQAGRPDAAGTDVPFARSALPQLEVDIDAFESLCRHRRSVRWFRPRSVEREHIIRAVEVAKQAPSACNRQPFHFIVVDDPGQASEIASIALGTRGFSHNIPALAIVVGNLSAFPFERDRHLIYIDGALAAMQFMLAIESLGLASCPINWPDIEPREAAMAQKVELQDFERVVMLVAFGYADDDGYVAYSKKRSNILRWYNKDAS